MAKLTKSEADWSKPALHDLFEAGGLLKHSIRTAYHNYIIRSDLSDVAKTICDEIKYRTFHFEEASSAISTIANRTFFRSLHPETTRAPQTKRLTETQLANIIAAFCAEQEIFWDDVNTARTTTEMEVYRKSVLGKACWHFGCFLSQSVTKKGARTRTGTVTYTTDPATGKRIPKSDYKSSGPKSGLIKGLIGEPGEKTNFSRHTPLFVIVCTSTKTKKQYVFVDPLATKADPNKIKLGDPSGYSACKLFFDSIDAAQNAIDTIKAGDFRIPDDISELTLAKQTADRNGYFKISTEVGPAYIKASKLNEAIEEALEDSDTESTKNRTSRFPEIDDIDVYTEAMLRYE